MDLYQINSDYLQVEREMGMPRADCYFLLHAILFCLYFNKGVALYIYVT